MINVNIWGDENSVIKFVKCPPEFLNYLQIADSNSKVVSPILSEQHFTEGDEIEDNLDDDNIDYIIIEEIERSRKAIYRLC